MTQQESAQVLLSLLQFARNPGEGMEIRIFKDPKAWLEEVGENADLYRLTLGFEGKNSDWTVKSALLEPFKGLGFGR